MDFKGYLGKGLEITKLNRDAASDVAQDESSFGPAVLFFAIGGLSAGLGGSIFSGGASIIVFPLVTVAFSFIWVGILHIIARLFGGSAQYKGYYSALGLGSIPHWAAIIPFLGAIISLWFIPVAVVVTERVQRLSTAKAIMVVLLPLLIVVVFALLMIVLVGMAAVMAFFQSARTHGMQ